jgi:HK97 family phage major capsid protein
MTMLKSINDMIAKLNGEVAATLKFAADEGREPTAEELTKNQAKLDEVKNLEAKAKEMKELNFSVDEKINTLKALNDAAEKREQAAKHFSKEVEGKPTTQQQILNGGTGAGEKPELTFSKELTAFAAGKEYEFAAITVAANQAFIPKGVEILAVRKNLNAFRRLLEVFGYTVTDLPYVQNIDISVLAFADGQDGTEHADSVDGTPTPVTLSLAPSLVTSTVVWFGAAITEGPSFDATKAIYPGLQRAVERREENKWFAALKTQAGSDASMIGKTTASTTAVTYDEFVEWRNSMGAAYNIDAAFIMSVGLKSALEKIKDTAGNPILVQGADGLARIDGKPVIISDAFEAPGAGKFSGAIISAEGIRIVDAGPTKMKRYEGESNHSESVGFEVVRYSDAKFVAAAVKLLKFAAS